MRPYYQDDLVTIYHGDAREVVASLGPIDAVVTDPPYGLGVAYGVNRQRIHGDQTVELATWVPGAVALTEHSWVAIFCGWNGLGVVIDAMVAAGLTVKTTIVWDKLGPGYGWGVRDQHEFIVLGYRGQPPHPWNGGNVWRFSRVLADRIHPSEKPMALMRAAIVRLTDRSSTILDPFMGSGTTLVAAKDLGRSAIGIEIEERYCEIAANRCRQEVLGLLA